MTYTPGVPLANQDPSDSQGIMLINFQQLNTLFNIDHVTWNDATVANRGQHRQISLIDVIPDPNLSAPKCSVYTKLPLDSMSNPLTNNQLFFQNDSGASDIFQVTGGGLAATTWVQYNGSTNTVGQSLNVSSITKNSAGNYTINFINSYHSSDYCIQVTSNGLGNNIPVNFTRNTANLRISNVAGSDLSDFNVVIFGALE